MNAPQLLETLTRCGARVSVDGTALVVKPSEALTDELRAEIRAHKTALIEILAHGDRYASSSGASPLKSATNRVTISAPGAVQIGRGLRPYRALIAAAQKGHLPTTPLDVEIAGESHTLESPSAAVCVVHGEWSAAGSRCQNEKRGLTDPEIVALKNALEMLEWVAAAFDGSGAPWLNLISMNRK